MPILGWLLRLAENLFLMEVSGTCGYLSDKLLKTCRWGRCDSNVGIQCISEWESLLLMYLFL